VPPFSQPDEVKARAVGKFSRIELGGGGEPTQLLCGFLGSDHATPDDGGATGPPGGAIPGGGDAK